MEQVVILAKVHMPNIDFSYLGWIIALVLVVGIASYPKKK